MHPATNDRPRGTAFSSVPGAIMKVALAIAIAAVAAARDVLAGLLCRFLVHVASGPYPAGELYDPSEDYELAREVLAIEKLVTGRLGSAIGAARVLRLFGGIEPLPGLVHCTAAMRTTPRGGDVFLAFELDPLMLDDRGDIPHEFSVQVIRTPLADCWRSIERSEFADATTALMAFYSNLPARSHRG